MGNVYDIGGLRKFASGGVVDSPTLFKYGNGGKGLMGEAGPEAIVPLKRAANGDLGVSASVTPVTVNIINNSNSNVEQRETTGPGGEKTIDIIIAGRVRDGIISGKFDSAFKQSYGINRKGS
jgi:phage-related minor tail protein